MPSLPAPRLPHQSPSSIPSIPARRKQAIAAYREAVEVLGTPEVRDALSKLERSADLAEASVDAVAKALRRKLGLSERKQTAHDRLWALQYFLDSEMTVCVRRAASRPTTDQAGERQAEARASRSSRSRAACTSGIARVRDQCLGDSLRARGLCQLGSSVRTSLR
jgi:hypothetical protein